MLFGGAREVRRDNFVCLRRRIEASKAHPMPHGGMVEWKSMISDGRAGALLAAVPCLDGGLVRLPSGRNWPPVRIDGDGEIAKTACHDGSPSDRALDPAAGML
jgi:hypothetical protein